MSVAGRRLPFVLITPAHLWCDGPRSTPEARLAPAQHPKGEGKSGDTDPERTPTESLDPPEADLSFEPHGDITQLDQLQRRMEEVGSPLAWQGPTGRG